MKKSLLLITFVGFLALSAQAQILITPGTTYNQKFNILSSVESSSTPTGWSFIEIGEAANTTYVPADGTATTPNTYAFRNASATLEKAFGTLSGVTDFPPYVRSTIGANFQNDTGAELTAVTITYTGEQWSAGLNGLVDRLDFSYSMDATNLSTGIWTDVPELDFVSPVTTGPTALNGNDPANQETITFELVFSTPIPDGAQFWIRWVDFEPGTANFDLEHGLAIDEFFLTPVAENPTEVFIQSFGNEVAEGGAEFSFIIRANPAPVSDIQVELNYIGGSATRDDFGDFIDDIVTITAGSSGEFYTLVVTQDDLIEGDETATFELANVIGTNAVLGTPTQIDVTIIDDDFEALHYRSKADGDWNTLATWETSMDGLDPWVEATRIPDADSGPITVSSGNTVTLTSILQVDELTINGSLVRSAGDLFIADATGDDLIINGSLVHAGSASQIEFFGSNAVVAPNGIIEVQNNANNQSLYGTSPDITWGNNSVFYWNVASSFSNGNYFQGTPPASKPILRVAQFGSAVGTSSQFSVQGKFEVMAGATVTFAGSGTKTFRDGIYGDGTISQTGSSGALQITGTTAELSGSGILNLNPLNGLRIASGSTTTLRSNRTINSGPITVNGIFTFGNQPRILTLTHQSSGSTGITGTGTLNMSGAAHILRIAAQVPAFPTTFTTGTTSTVELNSSQQQTIPARNFANLLSTNTGARVLVSSGEIGVRGTFTPGTNAYTIENSTINYNGGSQDVAAFTYENLRIAGTGVKNLTGPANLNGTLNVNSGSTFDTNGNTFTLISTASETANIGVLPAGASIVGAVTAQRYMPAANRIYRYISSPVDNPAVSQLQDDFPVTGSFSGSDVISGLISGPSLFWYNETVPGTIDDGYVAYPSSSNTETLVNGRGYAAFIRNTETPTVIDYTGSPNTFNQTLPVTFTNTGNAQGDGWNLVGNPYPSAINWNNEGWTKNNVNDAVYIRDNVNGGIFVSYVNGVGTNGGDGRIASGQGFWVQTTGASPSLAVTETVKSSDKSVTFYRESEVMNILRLTLSQNAISDEIVLYFDPEFTDEFEGGEDAYNLPNDLFDLASINEKGETFSINGLNSMFCEKTIPMQISKLVKGTYQLNLSGLETFGESLEVSLMDNYTGETIDLTTNGIYEFLVDEEEESFASNRFALVIDRGALTPEIVVDANTLKANYDTGVQWYLNDAPIDGATSASYTALTSGTYTLEVSKGGCVATANIELTVTGTENEFGQKFQIYPNPTSDYINFAVIDDSFDNVTVEIMDIRGATKVVLPNIERGQTHTINLSSLPSGIYIVNVISGSQLYTHRIVKN